MQQPSGRTSLSVARWLSSYSSSAKCAGRLAASAPCEQRATVSDGCRSRAPTKSASTRTATHAGLSACAHLLRGAVVAVDAVAVVVLLLPSRPVHGHAALESVCRRAHATSGSAATQPARDRDTRHTTARTVRVAEEPPPVGRAPLLLHAELHLLPLELRARELHG
eukprot:scaffold659_cov329-Prasinococcus_capsulatus_cf.AAC.18